MGECAVCHVRSPYISNRLKICLSCMRRHPLRARAISRLVHEAGRRVFGLPGIPPQSKNGITCSSCMNACRIAEGGAGYCGMRQNMGGALTGQEPQRGKASYYYDPLPTNCVADWVCAGGTGCGYPRHAYRPGPEQGYENLAVFLEACSFHCLFCQNWHYLERMPTAKLITADAVARAVRHRTSCICFFGGDPTPQLPYALRIAETALERNRGRILRICWETNGSMNPALLDRMVELSLGSGGCVKFDLKAWDKNLHIAYTGSANRQTLKNFRRAGEKIAARSQPPLLVASTLLVPGYIDEIEVQGIARFIASIDAEIPYSLLAFYPRYLLQDLPLTPQSLAAKCLQAAHAAGLKNVRLGNTHLLDKSA